jgi:hypothetical protein
MKTRKKLAAFAALATVTAAALVMSACSGGASLTKILTDSANAVADTTQALTVKTVSTHTEDGQTLSTTSTVTFDGTKIKVDVSAEYMDGTTKKTDTTTGYSFYKNVAEAGADPIYQQSYRVKIGDGELSAVTQDSSDWDSLAYSVSGLDRGNLSQSLFDLIGIANYASKDKAVYTFGADEALKMVEEQQKKGVELDESALYFLSGNTVLTFTVADDKIAEYKTEYTSLVESSDKSKYEKQTTSETTTFTYGGSVVIPA